MKLIANNLKPKETFKTIREWTNLTQEDLAKELNKSKFGLKKYENGENRFYFETLLELCNKHNITITFEKRFK